MFSKYVDNFMEEVKKSFLAITGAVGLIAAAAPPSIIFAFATYNALLPTIGTTGAASVSIALAVALEATGVKISHVALEFFRLWRQGDKEARTTFIVATVLTLLYLASGATAVYFFDQHEVIRTAGFLSYSVAGIMYVASGLEMLMRGKVDGELAKLHETIDKLMSDNASLVGRLGAATKKVNKYEEQDDKTLTTLAKVEQQRDEALAERDKAQKELNKLLSGGVIDLSTLPAPLAMYTKLVADGHTPNGELTQEFGIGQSTMTRVNSAMLKE